MVQSVYRDLTFHIHICEKSVRISMPMDLWFGTTALRLLRDRMRGGERERKKNRGSKTWPWGTSKDMVVGSVECFFPKWRLWMCNLNGRRRTKQGQSHGGAGPEDSDWECQRQQKDRGGTLGFGREKLIRGDLGTEDSEANVAECKGSREQVDERK